MFAKGNLHGDGAKLARYIMTGENGEIAQLVETRGLEIFGGDPVAAFAVLQHIAEAQTKSDEGRFFTGRSGLRPANSLTDEQC